MSKEQNTAENGSPTKRRRLEVKTEPEISWEDEKTDVNGNISSTDHMPLCSLCVNQALFFCHQCKLKLCEDCESKHNDDGYAVFMSHNPVPLSKIIFCHDHPPHSQIAFCFCNTCSEWICAECVINAHDGHHMESMSTVAITLRKDIEESQQSTKQDVSKLDACLKQLDNVKSTYKIKVTSRREKTKEMKILATRLTSQLEQLEKEPECHKTTNKTLHKVRSQREQVIEDLATCTQFVEKCESLAKSDDMALFRRQQTQHPHELLLPRPQGDYNVSIPTLQPISPQLTERVLGTITEIRKGMCDFRDENQREDLIQLEVTQNMCDIIKTRSILYSKEKVIKDLPWTIGIMPGYKDKKKRLGIFLGCKGSPSGEWSCMASAKLTIRNQQDTDRDFTREITHKFTAKSEPWGFNEFIQWSRLFKPSRGYVKDGVILIEAQVTAKDPKIVQ